MRRGPRDFCHGLLLALLLTPTLGAPAASALDATRFAYEAPVLAEDARLLRLPLDPDVLAASRPGLADLRLVSPGGEEVPYLLLGKGSDQELVETRRVEAEPLDVHRERIEGVDRKPRTRQTLELPAPPDPGAGWTLVIDPGAVTTVRGLTLEGLAGGETAWREETSLFRLETGSERVRYDLPAARFDRLRVVLVGEEGGYLAPRFRYESQTVLAGAEPVEVSLKPTEIGPRLEPPPGWTALAVDRPRGVSPDRLRVTTTTAFFDRAVRVWDRGPGLEPREVGSGRIFRVPSFTEVEQLAVEVAPTAGDRLEIWVEAGDSPPLGDLAVRAVVDRPVLVFARPAGAEDDRVATLYFGGGAVERPRYDLASLAPPAGGPEGPLTGALRGTLDPTRAGRARLGSIAPNPAFDATAALAFALRPGAAVDPGSFRFRVPITVPAEGSGPSRIVIPAAALAELAPDLRDLRIVDDEGHQWPYLWTGESETRWLEAPFEVRSSAGETEIRVAPRPSPIPADRVRLELRSPTFVDRPYRLFVTGPGGGESGPTEGRLRLEPSSDRSALDLALPVGRVTSIRLAVVDGDERPLPIAGARLAVSEPILYLVAPAGSYHALVGAPQIEAPRYDLERERSLVLGLPAQTARVGEMEPNPERGLFAGLAGLPVARIGLWAALGLAVLGMGLLAFRLVREE